MSSFRTVRCLVAAVGAALLAACSPPEPIHIGYLGGLSGRVSDLGIGGLNGVKLAIEQRNAKGGINGRPIELVEGDDQQTPEAARNATQWLIRNRVAAIVGPMTSSMATHTIPLANEARIVMISPTATSTDFSGIDDYFFRVIPSTDGFVKTNAEYFLSLGLRRARLVYDLRNASYSESWMRDFTRFFAAGGGTTMPLGFTSSDDVDFRALAQKALADRPDALIIVANSVDTAMLCENVRKLDGKIPLGTSEWAATERLTELGGAAVEGVKVAQFHDRQGQQPTYLAFRDAYMRRFKHEPGFAGLFAFDAANVVFEALASKPKEQTLKERLLAKGNFAGAQRAIVFDRFGDTPGETNVNTIKDGQFVALVKDRKTQ